MKSTFPDNEVHNMVDQTTRMFESAMQCGMGIQQASARWLLSTLGDPRLFAAWQKQNQAVIEAAIDTGRHSVDAALQVMNQNTQLGLELLKESWEAGQKGLQKVVPAEVSAARA